MAKIDFKGVKIEWLGHASFRIRSTGVIYMDPYKVGGEKADIILITHGHYDHCDTESVSGLRKPGTVVLSGPSCEGKVDGTVMRPGDAVAVKGFDIKAVHAYNVGKSFHPKGSGVGFIIETRGVRIYHAGDTDRIPEMKALGRIDIALLPVGGTYTMDAKEAAAAAEDFEPEIVIPMHYGSIAGSRKDAENFRKLCKRKTELL